MDVTTQGSLYGASAGDPGAERVGTNLLEEASPTSREPWLEVTRGGLHVTLQGPHDPKSWVNICQMSDHKRTSHAKTVLSSMASSLGFSPGGSNALAIAEAGGLEEESWEKDRQPNRPASLPGF